MVQRLGRTETLSPQQIPRTKPTQRIAKGHGRVQMLQCNNARRQNQSIHTTMPSNKRSSQSTSCASTRKTETTNPKFTFRTWLIRLGLNGEEFKTTKTTPTSKPRRRHSMERQQKDGSIMEERKMKEKLYIAYGSNLNLNQMSMRCPEAMPVGTAMLDGWQLTFRGVATLEKWKAQQCQ